MQTIHVILKCIPSIVPNQNESNKEKFIEWLKI